MGPSMDYKQRLHRPKAYNEPGHAHELTFSCHRRLRLLSKDRTCQWLATVTRQAVAYLRKSAPQWLENLVVQGKNRSTHRFWQAGRGYDRNITTFKALMAAVDYIHLNPVRKALVEQGSQWKWSSACWHVGSPLNDLRPDLIDGAWLDA